MYMYLYMYMRVRASKGSSGTDAAVDVSAVTGKPMEMNFSWLVNHLRSAGKNMRGVPLMVNVGREPSFLVWYK